MPDNLPAAVKKFIDDYKTITDIFGFYNKNIAARFRFASTLEIPVLEVPGYVLSTLEHENPLTKDVKSYSLTMKEASDCLKTHPVLKALSRIDGRLNQIYTLRMAGILAMIREAVNPHHFPEDSYEPSVFDFRIKTKKDLDATVHFGYMWCYSFDWAEKYAVCSANT